MFEAILLLASVGMLAALIYTSTRDTPESLQCRIWDLEDMIEHHGPNAAYQESLEAARQKLKKLLS